MGSARSSCVVLGFLMGCKGGQGNDSSDLSVCGDLDGDGTDTGNLPDIRGDWTSSFGTGIFQEDCGIGGMKQDDMDWINGGALLIEGRVPDRMIATFQGEDGEEFWGVMNDYGGVVFTGIHMHQGYEMHVSFGGQLYESVDLGRTRLEGIAYLGVDSSGDGNLDCHLSGDFVGNKSGT
jgi:hypothetical protein